MNSWVYINHENINREKYQACIERNNCTSLYAQDFVWDCLHPEWDVLISGDYEKIMPLPFKSTFGMATQRQPMFIRTTPLIGPFTENEKTHLLDILNEQTSLIELNISSQFTNAGEGIGQYQYIDLPENYDMQRGLYSTNTKRILKKSFEDCKRAESTDIESFIDFFKQNVGIRHSKISDKSYTYLSLLLEKTIEMGIGKLHVVDGAEGPLCMAFFVDFKGTRYYLKGASNSKARERGAMFYLIDWAIKDAIDKGLKIFDFVGANNENIAAFNKKFGAVDGTYSIIKSNNLFWPLNKLISP